MTKKDEAMLKIKEQLKRLMRFSETPETATDDTKKFSTIKLEDGTEISIPEGGEIGVGTEVYSTDEAGNQTPLADGDYILEDGRTITVSSGSVESIGDTSDSETAKEETPSNDASTVADEKMDAVDGEEEEPVAGEPIEDRVSSLENQVAELIEMIQGMGSMTEVAMSKIEEIASAPATESIKVGKTPATSKEFNSIRNEMDELKEIVKNKFKNKY